MRQYNAKLEDKIFSKVSILEEIIRESNNIKNVISNNLMGNAYEKKFI